MSILNANDFSDTFSISKSGLSLVYFRQGPLVHFDKIFNELSQRKTSIGLNMISFYVIELTPFLISKASSNDPPISLTAPKILLFKNHKAFSNIRISDLQGLVMTLKEILTREMGDSYSVIPQHSNPQPQPQPFNVPALRGGRKFDQTTPLYTQNTDYNRELLAGDDGIIPYTVPWKADFR